MIRSILSNKCPNCKEGNIFENRNIYFNFFTNKMNTTCDNCGYKFEKEPGFFYGSMYVSYALGVAQAIITVLIGSYFYDTVLTPKLLPWIIIVLILMSSFNMRVSRIIWMYLFKDI